MASVALVLTVIGMWVAFSGIKILPKCRFGEAECYFRVEIDGHEYMKKRAIEGSTSNKGSGIGEPIMGAEALAIPILAVASAAVPATLCFAAVIIDGSGHLCHKNVPVDLHSSSKIIVGFVVALLFIGVRIIQDLTFDCRWWRDGLHGNESVCHTGLSLYILAVCIFMVGQVLVVVVSTSSVENLYSQYFSVSTGRGAPARVGVQQLGDGDDF